MPNVILKGGRFICDFNQNNTQEEKVVAFTLQFKRQGEAGTLILNADNQLCIEDTAVITLDISDVYISSALLTDDVAMSVDSLALEEYVPGSYSTQSWVCFHRRELGEGEMADEMHEAVHLKPCDPYHSLGFLDSLTCSAGMLASDGLYMAAVLGVSRHQCFITKEYGWPTQSIVSVSLSSQQPVLRQAVRTIFDADHMGEKDAGSCLAVSTRSCVIV